MSCNRCENVPEEAPVDHVLLAVPHASTSVKILASLTAAGLAPRETELGIRLDPAGGDHKRLLVDLSKGLAEAECRDTQVALVPRGAGPVQRQMALFQSRRLSELVEHFGHAWIYDLLRRDALAVHFHPLVQHPPGRLHAYECLLRGVNEDGSIVSPGALFAAARSLDLLFLLDQKARLAAVRAAGALKRPDLRFFINFLPTAIYNPEHCLRTTLAAIERTGLAPEQIVFEVVESENVTDRKHLVNVLRFYRDRGFKVALDDVGAGYSSLLALSDLRPDYIKLDGEFVRAAAKGGLEGRIVRDLAEAARQHGIITIAEGIETDAQLKYALDAGIRITQGYVHGKPRAALLDDAECAAAFDRCGRLSGKAQAGCED